jgi:hypothetical protein
VTYKQQPPAAAAAAAAAADSSTHDYLETGGESTENIMQESHGQFHADSWQEGSAEESTPREWSTNSGEEVKLF